MMIRQIIATCLVLLPALVIGFPTPILRREADTVTITKTVTNAATVSVCPTSSTGLSSTTTSSTGKQTTSTTGRLSTTTTPKPSTTTSSKSTSSTTTSVPAPSGSVIQQGKCYVVPEAGTFFNKKVFTFSSGVPDGLYASTYAVYDTESGAPYNHHFESKNVRTKNNFLELLVPGGQDPGTQDGNSISSAEICTTEDQILYASVRTEAIFSREPGTCHGNFFYKSDTQEIDIEYVTDPTSLSNPGANKPIPLWYSNQAVVAGDIPTHATGAAPVDCGEKVHEYRIDWTKNFTSFYLDGVMQYKYTTNVPSKAGPWIWNNWANGDAGKSFPIVNYSSTDLSLGWSVGPPLKDNIFKIQKITMYYNTTSSAKSKC